jgi:ribosomal-protein-alanine N-acetyltransferase
MLAGLSTERLRLREWRESDLPAFAALNADRRVMEFMPRRLNRAESDDLAGIIMAHFDRYGFGLWAVEVPGVAPFIGFVGLWVPSFEAHFAPCVEVGWRLAFGDMATRPKPPGARWHMAFVCLGLRKSFPSRR